MSYRTGFSSAGYRGSVPWQHYRRYSWLIIWPLIGLLQGTIPWQYCGHSIIIILQMTLMLWMLCQHQSSESRVPWQQKQRHSVVTLDHMISAQIIHMSVKTRSYFHHTLLETTLSHMYCNGSTFMHNYIAEIIFHDRRHIPFKTIVQKKALIYHYTRCSLLLKYMESLLLNIRHLVDLLWYSEMLTCFMFTMLARDSFSFAVLL